MESVTELADIIKTTLNKFGKEVNDPRPIFIEGPAEHLSINERIDRVLANKVSIQAHERGFETYEEANDFDVEDPFELKDPQTQYTVLDEDLPSEDLPSEGPDEEEGLTEDPEPTKVEDPVSSEEEPTE